ESVLRNDRLDEGVDRRVRADLRHREEPELIEVCDVELRADRGVDRRARRVVRTPLRRVLEVGVLEGDEVVAVQDLGNIGRADTLPRFVAGTGRAGGGAAELRGRIETVGTAVAHVDQRRLARRHRDLAEALVAPRVVVRTQTVRGRRVAPFLGRTVIRAVEEDL